MWTPDRAVLEANLSFYEAFANADYAAMDALWSKDRPLCCVHPGWQPLHGREEVMASWRAVLRSDGPAILCANARASVYDDCAHVTCLEHLGADPLDAEYRGDAGSPARLAATNVFTLEGGLWRMVLHHASPFAERDLPLPVGRPPGALN